MAYPVKDDVKALLTPYHGKLRKVAHDAWQEWRMVQDFRVSAGLPSLLYTRTIANYVFDAIARRAIPLFAAEPRVSVQIEAQTFKLAFRGVAARYKKGGDDGLGCSIPTQAALAFMEADGLLPGLPPETAKVEIIWLPNDIWTRLEHVLVVARDGDTLLWQYEIDDADEGGGSGTIIPFPSAPPPDPAPETDNSNLVKPKSTP